MHAPKYIPKFTYLSMLMATRLNMDEVLHTTSRAM